jgi:hypothetical protein
VGLHAPALQVTVPPLGGVQALPQAPQLLTLLVVSTSHPSLHRPLQSANPDAHAPQPQAPATHVAGACAGAGQVFVHAPQCARSFEVSTSHPFVAMPSQSAKGAVHAIPQVGPAPESPHVAVACGAAGHACPHEGQLPTLVVGVSQPFDAMPSQSAKPRAHAT